MTNVNYLLQFQVGKSPTGHSAKTLCRLKNIDGHLGPPWKILVTCIVRLWWKAVWTVPALSESGPLAGCTAPGPLRWIGSVGAS